MTLHVSAHAARRWSGLYLKDRELGAARRALEAFVRGGTSSTLPPPGVWMTARMGTTYVTNPSRPDVCAVVVDRCVTTVIDGLVRRSEQERIRGGHVLARILGARFPVRVEVAR